MSLVPNWKVILGVSIRYHDDRQVFSDDRQVFSHSVLDDVDYFADVIAQESIHFWFSSVYSSLFLEYLIDAWPLSIYLSQTRFFLPTSICFRVAAKSVKAYTAEIYFIQLIVDADKYNNVMFQASRMNRKLKKVYK